MLEQNFQGVFQEHCIERPLDLQHHRLVVVMYVNNLLLKEPTLNRTERNRSRHCTLFCMNRLIHTCDCNQLRDCLVLENLPRSERSEEHTSELQSRLQLVGRLLLEKKKTQVLQAFEGLALRMGVTLHRDKTQF